MNEAQVSVLIQKALEHQNPNSLWLGFILLGGLYVIKELWAKLQEKNKDPDGIVHREITRGAISKIESRQTEIMEDMTDMKHRIRHIEKLMEEK